MNCQTFSWNPRMRGKSHHHFLCHTYKCNVTSHSCCCTPTSGTFQYNKHKDHLVSNTVYRPPINYKALMRSMTYLMKSMIYLMRSMTCSLISSFLNSVLCEQCIISFTKKRSLESVLFALLAYNSFSQIFFLVSFNRNQPDTSEIP